MTDPIAFTSSTPRFGLPLLFAAQAQKEFYVNEAHALIDALCHTVVRGVASSAQTDAVNGDCWIVGADGTDSFAGREDHLACYQDGQWLFIEPTLGMTVFDLSLSQRRYFSQAWQVAPAIPTPVNGTVIDTEARDAISLLVSALAHAGILPTT